MISSINSMDLMVHHFIQNHFRSVPMDQLMTFFTRLGDYGALWILVAIGLLIFPNTRTLGLLTVITLMVTTILGEGVIKHLFQRPRPPLPSSTTLLLQHIPSTFSFPSGHTAASFGAASTLFHLKMPAIPKKIILLLIFFFAGAIAFSRLYLGLHYFTDLMGGITLGIICSLWVIKKVKPALEKVTRTGLPL